MKSTYNIRFSIIFTTLLFMSFSLKMLTYNDTQSNVSTPKGSSVLAYITEESSEATRASWDSYFAIAYPYADQIVTYGVYSSTRKFNCHGYAWHIIEGGSDRWIGYEYTTDEDIYMTDGSYVQVANEMYPGKVSWGSGDHSAITTSQTGKYKSKWNEWPLMEHDWDDTPFGTSNLKYYVSTGISGSSSVLCNNSTRSFSARNIPNADYDWSVGNGITLNSDGNYNTSVSANSSYSGETWIEVEITSPLGGTNEDIKTSKRIFFWVGKPGYTLSGPTELEVRELGIADINYIGNPNVSNVNWSRSGAIASVTGSYVIGRFRAGSQPGYGNVYANVTNACGSVEKTILVNVTGGWHKAYPNPTKDILTVELDKDKMPASLKSEKVEIRLYDKMANLKKMKSFQGVSTTLNMNGLKPDVYLLQIKIGDKIVEEKIIVAER